MAIFICNAYYHKKTKRVTLPAVGGFLAAGVWFVYFESQGASAFFTTPTSILLFFTDYVFVYIVIELIADKFKKDKNRDE